MAAPTDIGEITISLPVVLSLVSTFLTFVLGGFGWFLNYTLHKLEKSIELIQTQLGSLDAYIGQVETSARHEREQSCREVQRVMEELRRESRDCQEARRREHTHCIDTFGKFGSRLSRMEGEYQAQTSKAGPC